MTTSKNQQLARAVVDFLDRSIRNGTVKEEDAEGLEVAIQCIAESFEVDMEDESLSIAPTTLESLFDVFLNTQAKLKPTDAERKREADAKKAKANEKMVQKEYDAAIALYTEAIALDEGNAIYYSNRAAAYSQNGDHDEAIDDAKKAVEIDPNYAKAYSRMGHAYFSKGMFQEAVDAYERGLKLEPANATMAQSLQAAKAKLAPAVSVERSAEDPTPGMPTDIGSMLNNPNFMQMASQMMNNPALSSMMNNPAISQMAQNLMSNPEALQNLMSNPALANMAKETIGKNPEAFDPPPPSE